MASRQSLMHAADRTGSAKKPASPGCTLWASRIRLPARCARLPSRLHGWPGPFAPSSALVWPWMLHQPEQPLEPVDSLANSMSGAEEVVLILPLRKSVLNGHSDARGD